MTTFKYFLKRFAFQVLGVEGLDYAARLIDQIRINENSGSSLRLLDKSHYQHLGHDSLFYQLYSDSLNRAGNIHSDNISKELRYYNLYSAIRSVLDQGIDGCFAECGCWHGHSLFMTLSLQRYYEDARDTHVFDSFEGGLSTFKQQDLQNIRLTDMTLDQLSAEFASSYDLLSEKCQDLGYTNVFLNKGWIPQVFNGYPSKRYAFVHIDVDLYEPTLESLNFFYPKLNRGGVIICDDYSYSLFPGAKQAVDEFIKLNNNSCIFQPFSIGGCMIMKKQ